MKLLAFFENLSSRHKLFLAIFILSLISLLAAFVFLNVLTAIIVSIVQCFIIFITSPIWLPRDYGKNSIRKLSIGVACTIALSSSLWSQAKEVIVIRVFETYFPKYSDQLEKNIEVIPVSVLFFVLLVILIVNYYMRDKTAMGIAENYSSEELDSNDYKDRMSRVCESLRDDIRSIDIQTNWSIHNFVPLEAEVEVRKSNGTNKRIADLLTAIKKSNDRLFLVLGDPGSGKSVALRKLASDLLSEAKYTKKIPVYINLREWKTDRQWTALEPPTLQELMDFTKKNLKNRDIITSKFFNRHFDSLYENGNLYFILDSFDEIPAILNEKENSELIDHVSSTIFKFLKGARSKSSQGILSSRVFRKPTKEFQSNTVLEIRPFSEDKIISTLEKSDRFDKELINKLFKTRLDLIPVSRNPFTLALISDFVENNDFQLPENQSSIYSSYIRNTLENCEDRILSKELTVDLVISHFKTMSNFIFENYGIEAPINQLINRLPGVPVADVIEIITFAKIGRLGTGDSNTFSYSHRRFCEYFSVQYKIDNNEIIDLDSIPQDSQWRDALVLYCEVVDKDRAIHIANFCWDTIKKHNNLQKVEAIHCLRFLNDAFKGRLDCIKGFYPELSNFINEQIDDDKSMISTKLSIESVGLLKADEIDSVTIKAFNLNNSWLNETCLRGCRHLSGISPSLEKQIIRYLNSLGIGDVLEHRKDLDFSLRLSEGLKSSLLFLKLRELDIIQFCIGTLVAAILFPKTSFFVMTLLLTIFILARYKRWLLIIGNSSSQSTDGLRVFRLIISFSMSVGVLTFLGDIEFYTRTEIVGIVIITTLIIPYYSLVYLPKLFNAPNWKVVLQVMIAGFLGMTGLYLLDKFDIIDYFFAFAIGLLLTFGIFVIVQQLLLGRRLYHDINKTRLINREYIHTCMTKLEDYKFYQEKLISYLETEIKEVKGEWPDDELLKVSNDSIKIRLARLEEKWLKINR